MGKEYKVYRVDDFTERKIPIGTVTERRRQARGHAGNLGLIKTRPEDVRATPEDQVRIVVGEEQVV